MPSSDLILNVKQIYGYPATPNGVQDSDAVVIQRGLGGPYYAASAAQLISVGLIDGGAPLQVNGPAPDDTAEPLVYTDYVALPSDGGLIWNGYVSAAAPGVKPLGGGTAGYLAFDPVGGWPFWSVSSSGSTQALNISLTGYISGGEQIALRRDPAAPMEAATAQWVQATINSSIALLQSLYSTATVWSLNGRTGNVILNLYDVMGAGGAPIFSPAFQGQPTAPTPIPADNSTSIATTAWVWATVNTVLGGLNLSGYAPLANPNFSGIPTAPTAAHGTSDGQLATTAFVQAAVVASTGGVSSFNTRVGNVTLTSADITGAGGVLLTGAVTSFNTRTGSIALTTADVTGAGGAPLASPTFTGTPAGPTAIAGTNTTQLATTAFVAAAVAAVGAAVTSFNGRTGAVTLIANDVSAAGGAVLASPAFTGAPTAPTAVSGTNTTQLATTAFVMAAIAQPATVAPLMNQATAAVGTSLLYARQDHVHPTDTSRAAQSSLANYLPLAGGTMTGKLAFSTPTSLAMSWRTDGFGLVADIAATLPTPSYLVFSPIGVSGEIPVVECFYQGASTIGIFTINQSGVTSNVYWTVTVSDRAFKSNFTACGDALAAVLRLKVHECDVTPPGSETAQHLDYSVIADEVREVVPSAFIRGPENSYDSVRELPLVAALIRAVQQLTARVAALEAA